MKLLLVPIAICLYQFSFSYTRQHLYKIDNPKSTIQEIRAYILSTLSLDMGKSTVGDILKMKEKWLAIVEDSPDLRRIREPKHQQMEDAVFMWLSDMMSHHSSVIDVMLLMKAKTLGQQLNVTDFGYSRGWL